MAKKKTLSRGQKISLGLKKYHEERRYLQSLFEKQLAKDEREKLKRNNARRITTRKSSKRVSARTTKKSGVTFTVKRKRAKVKSFPKKDSKDYFYAEKRYYELDVPLIIDNETQAGRIQADIEGVRSQMKDDLLTADNTPNRLVNIGYDISLTFHSKDKKKSKDVNIDKVCYTPSVLIETKKDFDAAFNLLQTEIRERFVKYFGKTGFGGVIGIRGFETEISRESF